MIITIDGPAGSGKSSIAALLARECGFFNLCSGFIYRTFSHHLLQHNIAADANEKEILGALNSCSIVFTNDHGVCNVLCNNNDVTQAIKSEACGVYAANISHIQGIRDNARLLQRSTAQNHPHTVIEGRDCGTAIFPDADLKLYLIAPLEHRAQRVSHRSKQNNPLVENQAIKSIIINRDLKDITRKSGALKPAHDAYIIETSNMNLAGVLSYSKKLLKKHLQKAESPLKINKFL